MLWLMKPAFLALLICSLPSRGLANRQLDVRPLLVGTHELAKASEASGRRDASLAD